MHSFHCDSKLHKGVKRKEKKIFTIDLNKWHDEIFKQLLEWKKEKRFKIQERAKETKYYQNKNEVSLIDNAMSIKKSNGYIQIKGVKNISGFDSIKG